jgi:hypothetical protein
VIAGPGAKSSRSRPERSSNTPAFLIDNGHVIHPSVYTSIGTQPDRHSRIEKILQA